jgi:sugar phosphate isomerase/epimerase
MTRHRLSLAAGVLADYDAEDVAIAACESGFRDVGFTVKPWSDAYTQRLADRLVQGSVRVLDVEVVRIDAAGNVSDDDRRIVDVGAALGAENVLVISACADPGRTADALARLAEQGAPYGLRTCLEFMRFTQVPTMAVALDVLARVSSPSAGMLIDTLHLARTGELDRVGAVPVGLLSYAQFCDGLAGCGDDDASLIRDALDDRSAPGEGALPLSYMLQALPDGIPLSLEVRSKALRERFPGAVDRAAYLLRRSRQFLKDIGRSYDE